MQDAFDEILSSGNDLSLLERLVGEATFASINTAVDKQDRRLIHVVARIGNLALLRLVLSKGGNLALSDIFGKTALHYACDYSWEDVVDLLLSSRPDYAMVLDKDGNSALYYAAKHLVVVRQLAHEDRSEDEVVAKSLHARKIVDLLVSKVGIDWSDSGGLSLLHMAAQWRNSQLVYLLLDKGISPHLREKEGKTALHIAARLNCADICHFLVKKGGAALFSVDYQGETAFLEASSWGSHDALRVLLDLAKEFLNGDALQLNDAQKKELIRYCIYLGFFGASYDLFERVGYSLIGYPRKYGPISQGDVDSCITKESSFLRSRDAVLMYGSCSLIAVHADNQDKNTALHVSSKKNDFVSCALLIEYEEFFGERVKSNDSPSLFLLNSSGKRLVNKTNFDHNPPIFLTSDYEVYYLLREHGAKVDGVNLLDQGILHIASLNGLGIVCGNLLRSGMLVRCGRLSDKKGHTPLHLAALKGHIDICRMLIAYTIFVPTQGQMCYKSMFSPLADLFYVVVRKQETEDEVNDNLIKKYWDDNFMSPIEGIDILSKVKKADFRGTVYLRVLEIIYRNTLEELISLAKELCKLDLQAPVRALLNPETIEKLFGVEIKEHIMQRLGLDWRLAYLY